VKLTQLSFFTTLGHEISMLHSVSCVTRKISVWHKIRLLISELQIWLPANLLSCQCVDVLMRWDILFHQQLCCFVNVEVRSHETANSTLNCRHHAQRYRVKVSLWFVISCSLLCSIGVNIDDDNDDELRFAS